MGAYDEGSYPCWGLPAPGDVAAQPVSTPSVAAPAAFDLACLADALPNLGSVLWLERRAAEAPRGRAPNARGVVLLDHPSLGALAQCVEARAHHAVTPFGPREWWSFHGHAGDPLAKMFLLPDTDYLAWDEMSAACRLTPSSEAPTHRKAHGAFLRGALARLGHAWRARLLVFELRRLPWLRTLDACAPLRISLLGLELARSIARDEGAEIVSPLHTA